MQTIRAFREINSMCCLSQVTHCGQGVQSTSEMHPAVATAAAVMVGRGIGGGNGRTRGSDTSKFSLPSTSKCDDITGTTSNTTFSRSWPL